MKVLIMFDEHEMFGQHKKFLAMELGNVTLSLTSDAVNHPIYGVPMYVRSELSLRGTIIKRKFYTSAPPSEEWQKETPQLPDGQKLLGEPK